MSSSSSPDSEDQELSGRVTVLEKQYKDGMTAQAAILAEVREFREDFRSYSKIISGELTRLYQCVREVKDELVKAREPSKANGSADVT